MPDEPKVEIAEPTLVAATWRNLVMVVVGGETTGPLAEKVRRVALAHLRSSGRVALLFDTLPDTATPTAEARTAYRQMVIDGGAGFVGAAIAIEAGGFQASTLRAVINSLNVFARPAFPIKSMASLEEAAAWTSSVLSREGLPAPTAAEIVAALEPLRQRVRSGKNERALT